MKKIYSLIILAIALIAGCKPDFGDVNVDPTKITAASTRTLLTNTLQKIANPLYGNPDSAVYEPHPTLYVQYLSEGPYPGSSLYETRNLDWDLYYIRPLTNLQTIIDYNNNGSTGASESVNGSKNNQIGVARILKAYFFWTLTDRYGDIPYSEALQGAANLTPKYDAQKDIYYDLFKELKEASEQINESETPVQGDILLNGDMARWKQFANTVRLFMALRLVKNDFAKGQTEFNDALASGVLTSNADNIEYHFLEGDPNNYNPWYYNYSVDNRNDYAISSTMTDYMAPKQDPRLPVFGEVLANGSVTGLSYGSATARNIPGAFSRVGGAFRGAGSPQSIFNYGQVLFAQAEAAKVGYLPGGDAAAATFYADAIKASFEMYGITDPAAYTAYMARPGVAYAAAAGLQQIISQKWVHQYLNGFEAWADWRRTGFPVLTPAPGGAQDVIPRRLGYPSNEPAINGANYQEAVSRQGPDDLNTPIWWDK